MPGTRSPHFDNTITLGAILQLITVLLAMWAATVRLENRIAAIETKLDPLWADFVRRAQ